MDYQWQYIIIEKDYKLDYRWNWTIHTIGNQAVIMYKKAGYTC